MGKSFTSSHGLVAVDLDGDVLESGFELLMLIVSGLFGVDTELEMETVDLAVSVFYKVLPIYVDMNVTVRQLWTTLKGINLPYMLPTKKSPPVYHLRAPSWWLNIADVALFPWEPSCLIWKKEKGTLVVGGT